MDVGRYEELVQRSRNARYTDSDIVDTVMDGFAVSVVSGLRGMGNEGSGYSAWLNFIPVYAVTYNACDAGWRRDAAMNYAVRPGAEPRQRVGKRETDRRESWEEKRERGSEIFDPPPVRRPLAPGFGATPTRRPRLPRTLETRAWPGLASRVADTWSDWNFHIHVSSAPVYAPKSRKRNVGNRWLSPCGRQSVPGSSSLGSSSR